MDVYLQESKIMGDFHLNHCKSMNFAYTKIKKMEKGRERMLVTKAQNTVELNDTTKLEFYRLIGEGYKAMQDGRTSTIEDVREKIDQRRKDRRG